MMINSNIFPIIIAGLMNGSFVIPAKYVRNSSNGKIWFNHSIIGCAIIPWIILLLILPNAIHNYFLLERNSLIFLILSGIIFGIGQVSFAYAIESIGIALSFAINLGIGVTIGSMFVVFYKSLFFTTQGYLVTLAVLLIISGLIINYFSGKKTNAQKYPVEIDNYPRGWLLASFTGITSGLQNITFVILAFHSTTQFQTGDSFWVWPPFLLAAALPMLFGFGYRIKKNRTVIENIDHKSWSLVLKNISLIALMGLFFTGSLALYSRGMSQMNHQQQIAGWPAFMVSIILISQAWGWFYKESANITTRGKLYKLVNIVLLVVAIVILAIES